MFARTTLLQWHLMQLNPRIWRYCNHFSNANVCCGCAKRKKMFVKNNLLRRYLFWVVDRTTMSTVFRKVFAIMSTVSTFSFGWVVAWNNNIRERLLRWKCSLFIHFHFVSDCEKFSQNHFYHSTCMFDKIAQNNLRN